MKLRSGVLAVLLVACAPNHGETFEKSMADARTAYSEGRFDVAAQKFDDASKAAKIPRDGVYARYEAANARARAGDVAGAAAMLRQLAGENNVDYSAQAAYRAADLAVKSDPAAGYAELEGVVVKFPDSADARVALDRIVRHDGDAAQAHLEALLPKVRGHAVEMDVQYEHAKRVAAAGKSEQAREEFIAVANRWPYPVGAYFDDSLFRAAEIESKLGRPNEAIALLERLLKFRETSVTIGTYERPRYIPAILKIAAIYEDDLHDRAKARDTYHRLYRDFTTSTLRDDALWHEAILWSADGDNDTACSRLATLASDIPDSRYVPCAIDKCPTIKRREKSKAPPTCHAYLTREPARKPGEEVAPNIDPTRPDDPK
jgi:tetratricopeptide (TPR) repeat protein